MPCLRRTRVGFGARFDRTEDRVGGLADDAEPVVGQAEPVAKLAAGGLGHRHDPVGPPRGGVFLEQPGQPPLPCGEDELGMGQGQRVVHGDDQPRHAPDRKEGVCRGEVHEVEPGSGDRTSHREHVAEPAPALGRSRRAGRLADLDDDPLQPRRDAHRVCRRPVDDHHELVRAALACQRVEQQAREPAEAAAVGQAASVKSDAHGRLARGPG